MNVKKIVFIFFLFSAVLFILLMFYVRFEHRSANSLDVRSKNLKYISGNFKTTLEKELINAGLSLTERASVIKAYTGNINFKALNERDEYTIVLSSSGNFISIDIDKGEAIYSVNKKQGGYFFEKTPSFIYITTVSVSGRIKSILWDSMIYKNVPPDVILSYADIFAWQIDFLTDVRDGDEFVVVYEVKRNRNGKVLSNRVIAGYYNGLVTGKKFCVYYKDDYYDENGESARSMFLKAPLQYRRISSYFSYKRFHPILKIVRPHLGIDYSAPIGTPVSSVADGVVVYKGWNGGYGNFVEIKHAMNYYTSYGHLSKFASNIYVGKKIKQGDVIGYVGMTGLATGPHLDFRIRQGERYLNYLKLKRASNKKLPISEIPCLRDTINKYFKGLIDGT